MRSLSMGLMKRAVAAAMAAGDQSSSYGPGVKFISAGNFGGTLGPFKIELHKFFNFFSI